MTILTSPKNNNQDKYSYDYANKCDCSDDDNCGCSYPNNMSHDFDNNDIEDEKNNGSKSVSQIAEQKLKATDCNCSVNRETTEIKTENVHLKKESICVCSPTECECRITSEEKNK